MFAQTHMDHLANGGIPIHEALLGEGLRSEIADGSDRRQREGRAAFRGRQPQPVRRVKGPARSPLFTRVRNRFGDFAARSTNSLPYGRGSDWVAVCLQPLTEPRP